MKEFTNWVEWLIGILTAMGLVGSGGFVFGRRRGKAETKQAELETETTQINNLKEIIDALEADRKRSREEYEMRINAIEDFYKQKQALMEEKWDLEKRAMQAEIQNLQIKLQAYENNHSNITPAAGSGL